jgi:adenylate cyclase
VDVGDLVALGLYDPSAPAAEQRLELIRYLIDLGATSDDLVAHRKELPRLAAIVALRGSPALTLSEAADRSGLSDQKLLTFMRAAGFPTPTADDRVFTDSMITAASTLTAAEALFGHEVVLQLVRVMGAEMARLSDAIVSSFLVNVEPQARQEDNAGLGVARANADAVALLPVVLQTLDTLLRQHLIASRRTLLGEAADAGYETQQLCVGFVDLVDSTALTQRLSIRELGAVLVEFERLASELVTDQGGRVVKLIGDEILFTVSDARTGCDIALTLVDAFEAHPRVPSVRAGLASGSVMLRDGDVFGPVVNLAARIVGLAPPDEVVMSVDMARAVAVPHRPIGAHTLKGWDEAIELCLIRGG